MYDIKKDGVSIGQAEVKKEGLYYCFICTCMPKSDGIHRIHVHDGETVRDLGICVPDGVGFRLCTRIPVKHFSGGEWNFELVGEKQKQTVISVRENEPFEYLDQLHTARLQNANGQAEIILPPAQDPPDSDLSQEYPNRWEQP